MTVFLNGSNVFAKGWKAAKPNQRSQTGMHGRDNVLGKQARPKTRAQRRSLMRGLER